MGYDGKENVSGGGGFGDVMGRGVGRLSEKREVAYRGMVMVFEGEAILMPEWGERGMARFAGGDWARVTIDEGWADRDEETKRNAEATYDRTKLSF